MANFNKVLLMGNLTHDPRMTYLPSNTPVVEFGMAVNRRFRKQDGEQGEEVLFIDCRAFGRTAELINQFFQKGRPIFVEGRLQLDQWQDKEGNKRSKHRVFVESFHFVDSKGDAAGHTGGGGEEDHGYSNQGQGGGNRGGYSSPRPASSAPQQGRAGAAPMVPPQPQQEAPEMEADDIPF